MFKHLRTFALLASARTIVVAKSAGTVGRRSQAAAAAHVSECVTRHALCTDCTRKSSAASLVIGVGSARPSTSRYLLLALAPSKAFLLW